MEITYKYHKTETISQWKRSGVIDENLTEIYETYINTMNCGHCGKVFESTRDRHLDHDHKTGLFRKIVCCACNMQDSYIRYPDKITKQDKKDNEKKKYYENNKEKYKEYYDNNRDKIIEKHKEYNEKNKEKIKEYQKEYSVKNRDKNNERRRKRYQEKKQLGIKLT